MAYALNLNIFHGNNPLIVLNITLQDTTQFMKLRAVNSAMPMPSVLSLSWNLWKNSELVMCSNVYVKKRKKKHGATYVNRSGMGSAHATLVPGFIHLDEC